MRQVTQRVKLNLVRQLYYRPNLPNTTALAMDSGRTLLIDRDELIAKADAAGIAIVADPV